VHFSVNKKEIQQQYTSTLQQEVQHHLAGQQTGSTATDKSAASTSTNEPTTEPLSHASKVPAAPTQHTSNTHAMLFTRIADPCEPHHNDNTFTMISLRQKYVGSPAAQKLTTADDLVRFNTS
jgi:hypothetical protein